MKHYFLLAFLIIISHHLLAQNIPIQLDRPDQTECPFIVPKKFIQVENGFSIENVNKAIKNYVYPSSLWKYGLHEKFEFRLITELNTVKQGIKNYTGINPITLGFKTNLCQEKGIIPITSVICHITSSNWGSKQFSTKYIAPSFRFCMQHTLNKKISLAYNIGAQWDGINPEQTYIYTLTSGVSITEKLGAYIELYGFAPRYGMADHRCDGGITYLINNDLILDLSGGLGLTTISPKNYIAFGVSYRFRAIK